MGVSPLHISTCSQGAGGLWMPYHCDDPRVDRWAKETLNELYPIAMDKFNPLVEWLPCVEMKQCHSGPSIEDFISEDYDGGTGGKSLLPDWSKDERLKFQHLSTEMLLWQNKVFKAKIPSQDNMIVDNYNYAWYFNSAIVDSPRMLQFMLDEIQNHNHTSHCDVETGHYYKSINEIVNYAKSLDCDAVVNCTGLGSRAICSDGHIVGARGVLLFFNRDTCVRTFTGSQDAVILVQEGPWGSESYPCYLIPRGDKLIVGGTYLKNDKSKEVTQGEREALLQNAQILGIDVNLSPPTGEWVGFRPYRTTTKCEIDEKVSDITFVHSYGHGGSGWTVNVGVAYETARLLGF